MTTRDRQKSPLTSVNDTGLQPSTRSKLALFAALVIAAGLFFLAWGYWGAWLPHPAAGLIILGIDLPEYVKFIPEVTRGEIPIKREIFFYPLLSLVVGLILLATIQHPRIPTRNRGAPVGPGCSSFPRYAAACLDAGPPAYTRISNTNSSHFLSPPGCASFAPHPPLSFRLDSGSALHFCRRRAFPGSEWIQSAAASP